MGDHVLPNGLMYQLTKAWLWLQHKQYGWSFDLFEDKYHDLLLTMLEASPDMRVQGYAPRTILLRHSHTWYSNRKMNRDTVVLDPSEVQEESYTPDTDAMILCARALTRLQTCERAKLALYLRIAGFSESEAASWMSVTRQAYWRLVQRAVDKVQEGGFCRG